ncbi:hypothetical protein [Flavobacterium sp. CS20]|uniref:hypothetical protein n=1 Tax=Flavobacterium sp. CS20 TaxID=2775246 RepID=UPI001B3A2E7E|nr:hypothetical protein [Flavobacterium sp. CS20]QTY27708.1 hypothetical protein IGB25_04035 [Flavobacterium sp. CS20]
MPTAFTICANNYLAHAKTLALSYKEFHPSHKFVTAILDQPDQNIDYKSLGADKVVWIHELLPELIGEIKETYSIAEICTVVKPELFKYFFNLGEETILYIDPDIKIFSKFIEVFSELEKNDMVLTPHICDPTPEIGHPQDKDLMRTGIYNLGFLALNKTQKTQLFLDWWDKRCKKYGYHDLKKGYFYDQIWLGYAPAFLDKVFILRHLGYNVANWNLHERKVIQDNEIYFINDKNTPLRFFHYSHFKMEKLPILASYNKNFTLDNRLDIVAPYMEYKQDLLDNDYEKLKTIDYFFGKKPSIDNNKKQARISRTKTAFKLFKKSARILIKGK